MLIRIRKKWRIIPHIFLVSQERRSNLLEAGEEEKGHV